jgi:hypothetical protein
MCWVFMSGGSPGTGTSPKTSAMSEAGNRNRGSSIPRRISLHRNRIVLRTLRAGLRHYFGNPGGYQRYLLAYNDLGTGDFNTSGAAQTPQEAAALVAARANTTANTLGVFPPMNNDFEQPWNWPGVDTDFVRTLHS